MTKGVVGLNVRERKIAEKVSNTCIAYLDCDYGYLNHINVRRMQHTCKHYVRVPSVGER